MEVPMKWPASITFVRHGQSTYNVLRAKKDADPLYQVFKGAFKENHRSEEATRLAMRIRANFSLGVSDYGTPLTEEGIRQAERTGARLQYEAPVPDVVLISPYLRTKETFGHMANEWPELKNLPSSSVVYDDRIREQEHGLSLLYNDWRVFQTFHPEQKDSHDLMGDYWYQYPQGESVSQVRDRIRLFIGMLIREYAERNVLVITHHLTILSARANLERLAPEEFIRLDTHNKPKNCGVTIYRGNPELGNDGKLELEFYNKCLWE